MWTIRGKSLHNAANKSRFIAGVVGRDLTAARQDYPVLWDCDDTPEGNRESQIPTRHGQTVKTALKKLATIQMIQRIGRAFEATVGSVFREGCGITPVNSGMVPLCLFSQISPCSVTSLSSLKSINQSLKSVRRSSKSIEKNFRVRHG